MRIFAAFCLVILSSVAANAEPTIWVDETVWDVGIIIDGQLYEKTVTVENAGDEPLVIEKVEQCCGFFGIMEEGLHLLPGEKAPLLLRIKTFKRLPGDFNERIFLDSNDPKNSRYSVFAVGHVVPKKHALGELSMGSIDLGILDRRDQASFNVRIKNAGNQPLTLVQVEKPTTVTETGKRIDVPAGGEGEFLFRYVPGETGPIEDKITFVTNDALDRTLTFQLKGYVAKERVPDRALIIYPVGKEIKWDYRMRSFRYNLSLDNRSEREVQIVGLESSLPIEKVEVPEVILPAQTGQGTVLFAGGAGAEPLKGYLYLNIALPIELR